MPLQIGIKPLDALEKFYEGETLGVIDGDFIKNQKQRNLMLPDLMVEFLKKYGYFNVNRGRNYLFIPDHIKQVQAKLGKVDVDALIIGMMNGQAIAVLAEDCTQTDPKLWIVEEIEDGDRSLQRSQWTLEKFLTLMIVESPTVFDTAVAYTDPEEKVDLVDEFDREIEKREDTLWALLATGERPGNYICWHESKQEFIGALLDEKDDIFIRFKPCFAIRELEALFSKEFYENASNCDFAHALSLLQRIIDYMENADETMPEPGEKYKLAGRCCWALKKWGEAEKYYLQAEKSLKNEMALVLEKAQSFYDGLGIFYLDREDVNKSSAAYAEVDRICDFSGMNSPRLKGNRLMRQGMMLTEGNQLKRAMEIYDLAIEEFMKDPKDCKYDLARCRQEKGDAKKRAKELGLI